MILQGYLIILPVIIIVIVVSILFVFVESIFMTAAGVVIRTITISIPPIPSSVISPITIAIIITTVSAITVLVNAQLSILIYIDRCITISKIKTGRTDHCSPFENKTTAGRIDIYLVITISQVRYRGISSVAIAINCHFIIPAYAKRDP